MTRKINLISDRKGMSFKYTLFSIMVMGLMVYAVTATLSNWNGAYNSNIVPDIDSYDMGVNISDETISYEERISPQSAGSGDDTETRTYRGVFGIITTIFKPLALLTGTGGLIDQIGLRFGINGYYITFFITLITLAAAYELVKIIFRYPGSNI